MRAFDAGLGVETEPVGEGAGEMAWAVERYHTVSDRAREIEASHLDTGYGRTWKTLLGSWNELRDGTLVVPSGYLKVVTLKG
ncbi:MAG: hypothetical protein M3N10_02840 [Actinomycetota bacterium]|nr:hypothetical protein [Actinomycetota bacterium]HZY64722.1 hypothetical protein [Rubrobacteraceae bacterium]